MTDSCMMYVILCVCKSVSYYDYCFAVQLNQVDKLKIRLHIMMFMGNFEDDFGLLSPVSFMFDTLNCHWIL